MKWLLREASLATALAALVVLLQPSWLSGVTTVWLVVIAAFACGAILSETLGRIPADTPPGDMTKAVPPGEVRQMRDIEQASDFLLAVDYQLSPFLSATVTEIAAHRLLVHHNVVLEREPERARQLLGDATWRLVEPADMNKALQRWRAVTPAQLADVTNVLENL